MYVRIHRYVCMCIHIYIYRYLYNYVSIYRSISAIIHMCTYRCMCGIWGQDVGFEIEGLGLRVDELEHFDREPDNQAAAPPLTV